jgi:aspartyl-tRNA(Asn)/glutamyl-tRNA(Gln) amidotransferase subunit C
MSERVTLRVTEEDAKRIAALARLRFDDDELTRITEELNRILDHVEELRSLESRIPDEPPGDERMSTRAPEADQRDTLRLDIGSFAPDWRDGFFVVPPLPGVQAEEGR